jgi:outer membrane protein TolC
VKEAYFRFLPEVGAWGTWTRYNVDQIMATPSELGGEILTPNNILNSLGIGHQDLFSGRLYAIQTLYAGGRGVGTLQMAKAALEQAQTDYDAARMDVRTQTKKVFYDLLGAQNRVSAIEQAQKELAELDSASTDPLDRIEAASRRERLRQLAAEANRALQSKRLAYLQALNLELDTPVKLVGELKPQTVDVNLTRATVWAMELRPELKSQVYKAKLDDIGVALAQSRRLPTILFGGTYEALDNQFPLEKSDWEFGLSVRFPFNYDFWSEIKQKRAQQRQGQLKRASLEDEIRLDVRTAYDEIGFWQQELPRRQEALDSLRELLAKSPSQKGPRALSARMAVLDAELSYLEAVEKSLESRASLERAVGRDLD